MRNYSRDTRSPTPKTESISRVMSANKSMNTKPELMLRAALRKVGLPGYRLHWKGAPGRPDICYPGRKIAIFVHGDFWHRCPTCNLPIPKNNYDFWYKKFEENIRRDERKVFELKNDGWNVVICWEHEIKQNVMECAFKIKSQYDSSNI
jgi:DNA mismatch endonuclease (patch repair protein)